MTKAKGAKGQGFAALREFVRGYLTQDYADEYGSAAGAAAAYCEDASEAESRAVAAQWRNFVESVAGCDAETINEKLAEELGSGWCVMKADDLGDVSRVLDKCLKSK
jgi:hypothetical protein